MSSAEIAARLFLSLEPRDFRVLQAIELGMIQHELVPHEEIEKFSSLSTSETEYRIAGLHKKELIYRQSDPYLGYIMNYNGYDTLALNALVKGDVIEALGPSVGVGKEADVFEALTSENRRVAIKFHRLGRTSFRDTRRKREYIADRRHISWLYQSRLAAEKEYEALRIAFDAGVSVPEPIHQTRPTIVMGFVEGYQLSDVIKLDQPEEFLDDILENVKRYYKAGIIHSDLSEYNVMVTEEGSIWLIDWPQCIAVDHPNADEILVRDVGNIVKYFERKYRVEMSLEEALSIVKA